VTLVEADLFPPLAAFGKADLIVCNPPWLPARPSSPLEHAIYDPDSTMLKGFLNGLAAHLSQGGEGWLILSDLAEHLGLRSRDELQAWIVSAGLKVLGKRDIRPQHGKAFDTSDALYAARSAELTSLWRLGAA
jgi:methylase of polypeptide subunit release factors